MTKKKENTYYYEPWKDLPHVWKTKSAFFNYIRGALRWQWKRYPLKLDFKNEKAIPNFPGSGVTNPKVKKVVQCEVCETWIPQSSAEIDHRVPCGTIKDWETAGQFIHNMFCDKSNLRCVCSPCHQTITYSERMGLSFEDAIIEKQVVQFGKLPAEEQIEKIKEIGLSPDRYPNKDKRKDVFREYLKLKRE